MRPEKMIGRRSIEQFLHRPRFELYDVKQDPDELHSLADDPAHAAVRDQLIAKVKAWQAATKDPWLFKWSYE